MAELTGWVRVDVEAARDWDNADTQTRPRPQPAKLLERSEEERTQASAGPSTEDMEALMALPEDATAEDIRAIQKRFQELSGRPPRPPRHQLRCTNCGRLGHATADCRSKGQPQAGQREQRCANSGKPGHRASDCNERRRDMSERLCFKCGKPGHSASQCPDSKDLN